MTQSGIWRRSLFVSCFIGHCLYYVTRKSLTFSVPILMEDSMMRMTKRDFGLMASLQMITYSIGKFLTGFLVDRYSNKKIFCFGLFCCGLTNLAFSAVGEKNMFFWIVLANGFFQAFGWNAIAVLVNQWYNKAEIGTVWSLLSSTINIGTSITPFIVMVITKDHHWKTCFFIIGSITCVFALIATVTIKEYQKPLPGLSDDKNKQSGVSSSTKVGNTADTNISKSSDSSQTISTKNEGTGSTPTSSPFTLLFTSPVFWLISSCYLLWSLVKVGSEDWLQLYLLTGRSSSQTEANFNVMVFQTGGFIASLISGGISDVLVQKYSTKMTGNPRVLVMIVSTLTSIVAFLLFILLDVVQLTNATVTIILSLACFILGFSCYGPHTLLGLVVMESAPSEMGGTTHSLSTTISTVGSVLGGYPLAFISSNYGWNGAYTSLMVISGVTCILFISLTQIEMKISKLKKD